MEKSLQSRLRLDEENISWFYFSVFQNACLYFVQVILSHKPKSKTREGNIEKNHPPTSIL